ncbi:MAG: hypothetical protein KatS3mg023_1323 [Armatimonadota bacterium]|nr:MAG: hypothetical protein KatS3mg023_1323 [Armatimonadota bacterium]
MPPGVQGDRFRLLRIGQWLLLVQGVVLHMGHECILSSQSRCSKSLRENWRQKSPIGMVFESIETPLVPSVLMS